MRARNGIAIADGQAWDYPVEGTVDGYAATVLATADVDLVDEGTVWFHYTDPRTDDRVDAEEPLAQFVAKINQGFDGKLPYAADVCYR